MTEDIEETLAELLGGLRARLPTYSSVDTGELVRAARQNVELALLALGERRAPTRQEIAKAASTAALRARQGVSVGDVLQGYRLLAREVWALFSRRARAADVEPALLLEAAELVWEWTDAATMQAALEHRQAELAIARRDQQQRLRFLTAVLFGSASASELHGRAPGYGLRTDLTYVPFRARGTKGETLADVERELRETLGLELLLVGTAEDDLAGLVETKPRVAHASLVVGFGPPAALAAMAPSFLLASRALETALRFGMKGGLGLEDVPLHAVIATEPHVGSILEARYLHPLESTGRLGRLVIETLEELFRQGLDVERTAAALSIHANTVRYRMRRFEEIAGARLSHPPDLIGTWWALERRPLREAPVGTLSPGSET